MFHKQWSAAFFPSGILGNTVQGKLLGAGDADRRCQRNSSEEQGQPGATPRLWRNFSEGGYCGRKKFQRRMWKNNWVQVYKIWWVGSEGTGEAGGCPLLVDKLFKADRSIGMVLKRKEWDWIWIKEGYGGWKDELQDLGWGEWWAKRKVLTFTDVAIVFTVTRFALFSLWVVMVGMKLECLEGPCRPSLAQAITWMILVTQVRGWGADVGWILWEMTFLWFSSNSFPQPNQKNHWTWGIWRGWWCSGSFKGKCL